MQKQTIREDLSAHRKPNRARTAEMCNFGGRKEPQVQCASGQRRRKKQKAASLCLANKIPPGGRPAEKRKKSRHSVAGFLKA